MECLAASLVSPTGAAGAAVMISVFAIFATLGMLDFKMMGVGLAVAVLIGFRPERSP